MKKIVKGCVFLLTLCSLFGCELFNEKPDDDTTDETPGDEILPPVEDEVCNHVPSSLVTTKTEPTLYKNGSATFICGECEKEFEGVIPMLNSKNYTVNTEPATCTEEGLSTFTSELYGNYSAVVAKEPHTSYGGYCNTCNKVINNLSFSTDNITQVSPDGGYPRLYILNDGTWICGYDTGEIKVRRSNNEGKTWSEPVIASVHPGYACANVAFYQFDNGDILCAYRAINNPDDPYGRYIQCTISRDNGYTWEFHSTIESNYQTAEDLGYTAEDVETAVKHDHRVGFFEPHFGVVNGKVTVMYADDFTTMLVNPRGEPWLNYETQYIVSRSLENGVWGERNIVLDGTVMKTVGDITDYSRDGMPVFDQLSDGTYVLVVEGTYRRTPDRGDNPFFIMLSYSKDGINWSTPVEVFVPQGTGSKASAPYVCVTSDDRLVISFQTDEDSVAAGTGIGDHVSIMKTIISDGTPVDKLTKDNFYEAQNVFDIPPGGVSSWNGMYMVDVVLYCVSGINSGNLHGVYINSAVIPPLEKETTGLDKVGDIQYDYTVRNGGIEGLESGWIRTSKNNTIVTLDELLLETGVISADVVPCYYNVMQNNSERNNCGIIFKASCTNDKYWKLGSSYYSLVIDYEGKLILSKVNNNNSVVLATSSELKEDFSRFNTYTLMVEVKDGNIKCFVNNVLLIEYKDSKPLTGNMVGIRGDKENTLFYNIVLDNSLPSDVHVHSFEQQWSSDEENHWHACSCGKKNSLSEHAWDDGIKDGVITTYTCTICGEAKEEYYNPYTTANGKVTPLENGIKSSSVDALAIYNNSTFTHGMISMEMKLGTAIGDNGIIFGLKNTTGKNIFWEGEGVTYYFFFVSKAGSAYLGKTTNGQWTVCGETPIEGFTLNKAYTLTVSRDKSNSSYDIINCYVDDVLYVSYKDTKAIDGTGYGIRAGSSGIEYGTFKISDEVRIEETTLTDYYLANGKFAYENNKIVSKAADSIAEFKDGEFVSGTLEATVKSNGNADNGLIFSLTSNASHVYWEAEVSYYFFFVNKDGVVMLGKVDNGLWTTCQELVYNGYDPYGTYNLKVVKEGTTIKCYVNDFCYITFVDSYPLQGTGYGLRAGGIGVEYTNISCK